MEATSNTEISVSCPECGGDVVLDDGRLECTDCSLLGVDGDAENTAKLWRLWGAARDLLEVARDIIEAHRQERILVGGFKTKCDCVLCDNARAAVEKAGARGGRHDLDCWIEKFFEERADR